MSNQRKTEKPTGAGKKPGLQTVFTYVGVSLLIANMGLSQGDPIGITPQSDTFAASGVDANSSYGDLGTLQVNGANASGIERRGFLTFMFTGQTLGYTGFSEARLELHMLSAAKAHTLEVYGVNHSVTWDEHSLTWNTAPDLTKDCTLLATCEVKPDDTSVVIKSEKLLEFVNGAKPRSVSLVLVGRNNDTSWNDPPYQFFSKENGLKKEDYGPYLPFGPNSPCLVLTPELSFKPDSVNNQNQAPTVTIHGRENSYYKIKYKEKESSVWKTANIIKAEAGSLYLDGVLTDGTGYASAICGQLTNIQADIKLEAVPFYTVSAASDPTFATLLKTRGATSSSKNPFCGSEVDVNNSLLEKGLGAVSDPRLITTDLQSQGGHITGKSAQESTHESIIEGVNSRWYQVHGNTQVFRSLDNEGTVFSPRVEARTGLFYDLVKKNIVCFEATYFLPFGSASTILQLGVAKNHIPELGIAYPFTALHADGNGYGISHTRYEKVQAWRGQKQYNFLQDPYAKSVTIRFRIDGTYYEYSLKKPDGTYEVLDGGYLPVPLIEGKKEIGFSW
ncbi:hypothetical protein M569_16576, partial [Genlisea aurea]